MKFEARLPLPPHNPIHGRAELSGKLGESPKPWRALPQFIPGKLRLADPHRPGEFLLGRLTPQLPDAFPDRPEVHSGL